MKGGLIIFTPLTALGLVSALSMGPVVLVDNQRYIDFDLGASPEKSLLRCTYALDDGEVLEHVNWTLWHGEEVVGTFLWLSPGNTEVWGVLNGMVKGIRDDGHLELTALQYNLSGNYSCAVTLTSGATAAAAKWEVLVIDKPGPRIRTFGMRPDCVLRTSFEASVVFPAARVRAGLYSKTLNGFYREVRKEDWEETVHPNGSLSYAYHDVDFKMGYDTPEDIELLINMGILKSDGNYISIYSSATKFTDNEWNERGCVFPRIGEYQHIEYTNKEVTCRNQLKADVSATVTCKKGYHADGNLTSVTVTCDRQLYKWVTKDGYTPKKEDLKCVTGDGHGDPDGATSTLSSVTLLWAALLLLAFSPAQ